MSFTETTLGQAQNIGSENTHRHDGQLWKEEDKLPTEGAERPEQQANFKPSLGGRPHPTGKEEQTPSQAATIEPVSLECGTEEFQKTFFKCFNRAALGNAAQLPELLRETRASGISDEEVRFNLEESQADLTEGIVDDEGYLIWRSQDDRLYVTCQTWNPKVTVASVKELFAELPASNPQASHTPQPGHLSSKLREHGEELTELEACILDAAQTLNKKFQHGLAVKSEQVRRVVMRYHDGLASSGEFKEACRYQ